MDKLRPLFPYFRPHRKQLLAGVVSILMTSIIGLMAPLVIGGAIDALRDDVSRRNLMFYGGLVVAIAAVRGVFQYFQRLILVSVSREIELDMRHELFVHLEKLHLGFYQKSNTGDLMARSTNDLNAVRMLCGPAIMYGTNTIFSGTGALLFMASIHGGLTLVATSVLPLIAIVTRVFGRRIHVLFESVQEQFSTLTTRVQENLAGARVIRAYVQETAEEEAFAEINREYVERNKKLILWNAAFYPFLQGVVGLGLVATLGYGGRLMLDGTLTVGQFVSFNLFLGLLAWPMIAIGWVINLAERGTASLARIRKILDEEPLIRDQEPLIRDAEIRGQIRFRDLDFTYEGTSTPTLSGIDLEIAAGQTVAIVGRTGSGKSTLLSLIPRLIDPPEGHLSIDGLEIRRLPLADLRQAIAVVPQETLLFSSTVRENISYGKAGASDEELLRFAALAGLEKEIESFPDGLDTVVGERGITLSGGQKQRVALARALLRAPQILILDDCLSAVDAETEERILHNLRSVFPGRTVLQVSHRVSAAQIADTIVVLDEGRIAERGTHAELIAHGGGIYADLERRQRLEEQLAAAV